jgi:hypothetical protein
LRVIIAPLTLAIVIFLRFLLFLNQVTSRSGHGCAENSGRTKMSLALCILETKVVTMVAVVDLNLAGSGNGKSLGRSLMRFDFSHFYLLL